MDKSWMHADRRSKEFELGFEEFLKFAESNAVNIDKISCPCKKCCNVDGFSVEVVRDHVFYYGILESYKVWRWHGESMYDNGVESESESESESVNGDPGMGENDVEVGESEDEEMSEDSNEFLKFVEDGDQPLYNGCDHTTKMNFLVESFSWKAKHVVTDSCFGDFLELVKGLLPAENLVPLTMKRRMDFTTDEWRTIVNQYGIPEQIGDKSCGYFIMLYMREIVQDKEQNWTKKWLTRGDEKYTMQDVDVVRQEWAERHIKNASGDTTVVSPDAENGIVRHGLVDNVWVTNLFNRRERWAEAFFKGHFYGGMCSTQCVEGMHSKLKPDLDRYTLISEMMLRMERSVSRIRDRVLYDNFRQKNSALVFETHMRRVEEDACRLLTYDIFIMIKCQILFEKQFVIVHRAPFSLTDTVVFNIARYPESLEKERWKMSVGDSTMAPCFKVPVDNKATQVARYSALVSEASKACSNYSFSEEGFRVGMNELARLVQSSIEFRVNPPAVDASKLPPSNVVRDPQIARTKGMHGNPSTGTKTGNTREQRNYGNCNLPGHNKLTCKAGA
ncbi:hypothetical protein ACLB2K_004503 [Fragaria x ananassa]